jgi:hypothetical protein
VAVHAAHCTCKVRPVSFWRRAKRLFSTDVEAIVGKDRVFGTDSECLDDGPSEVVHLLASVARIVHEHVRIERVSADEEWTVRFFTASDREWTDSISPRDYGGVFRLVNEALHDAGARRRVHIVSRRQGGQDFYVACATIEDAADLLAAGWIVECALPNVPHVIHHDGLRFHGHRPYRLSDRGSVIEAVLAERQRIEGLLCAADEVVAVSYEGGLESAILAEDIVVGGKLTVRAGSRIDFWNARKRIASEVTFVEEHEIDGMPCALGQSVSFREDGLLLSLTLARAHRAERGAGPYRGQEIARGSTLWFVDDGSIESIDEPLDSL